MGDGHGGMLFPNLGAWLYCVPAGGQYGNYKVCHNFGLMYGIRDDWRDGKLTGETAKWNYGIMNNRNHE